MPSLYEGVKKRKLKRLVGSLENRTTTSSAKRVLGKIAELQGKKATDTNWQHGTEGVREVLGEFNQKNRLKRIKQMAPTLTGRTTVSSLHRATNRALANVGQTVGLSGTQVDPRNRKPKKRYVR